jgi:hypothetical protein
MINQFCSLLQYLDISCHDQGRASAVFESASVGGDADYVTIH